MPWELKEFKKSKNEFDIILTYEKKPGFLGRLFNRKTKTIEFIGHSTVWHSFPSFIRCEPSTEYWLSDVYEKIKYEHGDELNLI